MKGKHTGFARLYYATCYSCKGLYAAFKYEAAFRQELFGCLILCPVALWLGQSRLEKAVLISVLGLVIVAELLNTAIEAVVDRVGEDYHELSGRAKDIGSAAVLVSILFASIVWALILI